MKELKKKVHYWCREVIEEGLTGRGVTAAVLDTGIAKHPDLTTRLLGWKDCVHDRNSYYDDNGHGTHVAGILAGDGRCRQGSYSGIAPGAGIVGVKVLDEKGDGRIEHVIQGIRYVLKERERMNIRIVNISIGTRPHPEDEEEERLLFWVERLWDAGLIVVTAAGNMGPESGSITLPGISKKVITVGACEEVIKQDGKAASIRLYSGCGPTKECVKKPDVSAPGNRIYSCNYRYPKISRTPYLIKSGTSMATPVVSGAAALLLEKYPDMSNIEVKIRLWNCCEDLGIPENRQGHGRIHIGKLLAEH